jgi:hypothetical protein
MWSLASSYTPPQVEQLQPLFHLLNGDLSYANISPDRVKAWRDFFLNNQISARNRPWMPCAGNHENELGNGPLGYRAYQTWFASEQWRGGPRLEWHDQRQCLTRALCALPFLREPGVEAAAVGDAREAISVGQYLQVGIRFH